MTDDEALQIILAAVAKVAPLKVGQVTESTDLLGDGIFDSLDIMSFLFEIEQRLGRRLTSIDENHSDYTIACLVKILQSA